jgi:hypothetical protein
MIPSYASEITSLTLRRPRRASLRKNALQNVSASEGNTKRSTDRAQRILLSAAGFLNAVF